MNHMKCFFQDLHFFAPRRATKTKMSSCTQTFPPYPLYPRAGPLSPINLSLLLPQAALQTSQALPNTEAAQGQFGPALNSQWDTANQPSQRANYICPAVLSTVLGFLLTDLHCHKRTPFQDISLMKLRSNRRLICFWLLFQASLHEN